MKPVDCLTIAVLAVSLAAIPFAGAIGAEDSQDGPFLAGLRSRRLFELAESYCSARLAEGGLSETRQADLVAELSVTLVERALDSPPEDREPLWRRAWEVTGQFAENNPTHPRLLLVQTQGALARVARGELGRQESEVLGDQEERRKQAREFLREAIRTLGELSQQAESALRERSLPGRHPAESPATLSVYQLATLLKQIQYQTARALRNQALCYDARSADRADALARALALLNDLARLDSSDPLAWDSRVDEIVCHRLLGDDAAAQRKIDAAEADSPPGEIAARLVAERIRLDLASGRLAEAAGRVNQLRSPTTPQLDYARLETALAAWQAADKAGQKETAAQWQTMSVALADQVAQYHGPYWSRLAKMLLAQSLKASPGGGNADVWARAAESSYLSGQFDEAITTYDQARDMARQQGDSDRAFQLGFVAATIERERGRSEEALQRYRDLAKAQPAHPKAPEAHQLAIEQAAAAAAASAPGAIDRFLALLVEHLESWPKGATANGVRWQLGRVRESQHDWRQAAALYRQITPDFAQFDQVIQAVHRCYRQSIAGLEAEGRPAGELAADAAHWFEAIALGPEGKPPERWSPRARQAVLAAAEFWLHDAPAGFDRAESILLAALAAGDDGPADWRSAAQALRVFSLAGQGRLPEASALLAQITEGSPDHLLTTLEGLAAMAPSAGGTVRRELAALELKTINLLRGQQGALSDRQRAMLERLAARALSDAGRGAESLQSYARLTQDYPNDGTIQEEYAQLLSEAGDRATLETALAQWRQVEQRSPAASDRWFRAKYAIALLHYRLGNPQQAKKIITLLQALHPELGGTQLKPQFLALMQKCG